MTDVTFEMLRLLMLYENLLVVELPVAVPEVRAKETIDNAREHTINVMFTLRMTQFRRPPILILFLIKLCKNIVKDTSTMVSMPSSSSCPLQRYSTENLKNK